MRRRTTREYAPTCDHPRGQQGRFLAPMRLTMAGAQNMISALSNSPPVVTKPNTSGTALRTGEKAFEKVGELLVKHVVDAGDTHHIDDKAPEARHTQQLCRRTQRKAWRLAPSASITWALLLLSGRDSQSSRPSTSAKPEAIQKVILGSMPNSTPELSRRIAPSRRSLRPALCHIQSGWPG